MRDGVVLVPLGSAGAWLVAVLAQAPGVSGDKKTSNALEFMKNRAAALSGRALEATKKGAYRAFSGIFRTWCGAVGGQSKGPKGFMDPKCDNSRLNDIILFQSFAG
jgi:hypothetical protein